jgi:hypothetical protein
MERALCKFSQQQLAQLLTSLKKFVGEPTVTADHSKSPIKVVTLHSDAVRGSMRGFLLRSLVRAGKETHLPSEIVHERSHALLLRRASHFLAYIEVNRGKCTLCVLSKGLSASDHAVVSQVSQQAGVVFNRKRALTITQGKLPDLLRQGVVGRKR